MIADLQGRFVEVNKTFTNIVGYSEKELIGRYFVDITHPDHIQEDDRNVKKLLSNKLVSFALEKRYIHKNKDVIWANINVTLIKDSKEKPMHLVAQVIDITERKRVEDNLRESKGFLDSIIDNLPLGLQIFDVNGMTVRINKSQKELLGIPDESIAVGSFNVLTDPFSLENGSAEFYQNVYKTRKSKNRELTVDFNNADEKYQMDKGVMYLREYVFPIFDRKKELLAVASLLQDISHEREGESKLRVSEEQFRNAIENSPMGVFLYELDDEQNLIVKKSNAAAGRILGTDSEQFIGKTIIEAFPPLAETDVPDHYKAAALQGEMWHSEQISYSDDQIAGAFEVYAFQVKPGSMAAMFLDITERKQYEDTLQTVIDLSKMVDQSNVDAEEIIRTGLEAGERITNSQIAFFHFVKSDQVSLSLQLWTKNTLNYCTASPKDTHYSIDEAEVWVDCVRERKPVVHNDYESLKHKKGLPEGHTPVLREMAVPIFEKNKIVAIIGVGNKKEDYTQFDVDKLSLIAETTWSLVQRKNAEEKIQKANKNMETIINSMPTGILIIGKDRKIRAANKAALEMMEYKKESEVVGMICHKRICPAELDDCPILDNGQAVDMSDKLLITKSNKEIQILKTVATVTMNDEDVLLESFVDITDQKQAEEKLKRSEEYLRMVVKSSPLAMSSSIEDKVDLINNRFLEMFG